MDGYRLLNLRALFRALFDIIGSSGRSPQELFVLSGNFPASVRPSNCPSVNISCYSIYSKTTGPIFLNLVIMFPSVSSCASTKKNSGPSTNIAYFVIFDFSCYHIFLVTYYRRENFVRVLHRSEGFARICHICEKLARILRRCDKYVRMFHTCKLRYLWNSRTY